MHGTQTSPIPQVACCKRPTFGSLAILAMHRLRHTPSASPMEAHFSGWKPEPATMIGSGRHSPIPPPVVEQLPKFDAIDAGTSSAGTQCAGLLSQQLGYPSAMGSLPGTPSQSVPPEPPVDEPAPAPPLPGPLVPEGWVSESDEQLASAVPSPPEAAATAQTTTNRESFFMGSSNDRRGSRRQAAWPSHGARPRTQAETQRFDGETGVEYARPMRFDRAVLATLCVLVLAACGGSTPPPAEPSPSPLPPTAAPESSAPAAPSTAPEASASSAPSSKPSEPPAPARAPATLEGNLFGKPFHAVAACAVMGAKEGSALIEVYDVKDFDVKKSCMVLPPVPGARKLGVLVPWKAGAKVDLASLKTVKDLAEAYVMEATAAKKFQVKDVAKDFKPQGTVELVRAGAKGEVGRIRLTMTVGKDKLEGEVDVEVPGDIPAAN